eukprot:4561750-Amphidinium_carterae.1
MNWPIPLPVLQTHFPKHCKMLRSQPASATLVNSDAHPFDIRTTSKSMSLIQMISVAAYAWNSAES